MFEGQTDQHLIVILMYFHQLKMEQIMESFVFEKFYSIFLKLLNENHGNMTVDEDGDLNLYRSERIDLTLGI